jgi:hypothetical protein
MTTQAKIRKRRRRRMPIGRILLIGGFILFVLAPLYWMFVTSIKPSDDYLAVPPVWFPSGPTSVHYTAALFAYRGLKGLTNSLIVSLSATVLSAFLGTLMAYSLARFNTGGAHLSFWVLSQRFLPPVAIVLPIFLIYRNIGLHDTHFGLIIAYTVFTLPPAGLGLDDVRLFPADAEIHGGRGARRRLHTLAGVLAGRGASSGARHRRGGGIRLHRLLDGILLRPRADEPLRLHASHRLPRLPRFPGRAIR